MRRAGSKGEKTEALSEGPKEKEKMTNATWRRNRGKKHLYNKFVKNKDTTTYNEDDMRFAWGGYFLAALPCCRVAVCSGAGARVVWNFECVIVSCREMFAFVVRT